MNFGKIFQLNHLYAIPIGAIQAVDQRYTEIGVKLQRIENQLKTRLTNHGLATEYKLQGSVPLDIHIKGVSDVDLLVIHKNHYHRRLYNFIKKMKI